MDKRKINLFKTILCVLICVILFLVIVYDFLIVDIAPDMVIVALFLMIGFINLLNWMNTTEYRSIKDNEKQE